MSFLLFTYSSRPNIYFILYYAFKKAGQCGGMTHIIELSAPITYFSACVRVYEGASILIYDVGCSKNVFNDCTWNSINYTVKPERAGAQCI